MMSGIIFFIYSILAISALFDAPKFSACLAALRWQKKKQEQKEGERIVSKSRLVMNVSSYLIATSSSAASSPIASKYPGMSIASVRPDSRMSVEPSSFDAVSRSQKRLKDAYLGGLKAEQRRDPSHQEEEEDSSESEPWYHKRVAQTNEACEKPFAGETTESISSAFQKSQK